MKDTLILTIKHEVIKLNYKMPSEDTDFDDFFSRFGLENYTDLMSQFEDK